MDKNSIIGLLLIGGILIGYTWLTKPSEEELKAMKTRDSIAQVERLQNEKLEAERVEALQKQYAEQKDTAALKESYGSLLMQSTKKKKVSH